MKFKLKAYYAQPLPMNYSAIVSSRNNTCICVNVNKHCQGIKPNNLTSLGDFCTLFVHQIFLSRYPKEYLQRPLGFDCKTWEHNIDIDLCNQLLHRSNLSTRPRLSRCRNWISFFRISTNQEQYGASK